MNIQRVSMASLHPAPYNPRKTLRPGSPGYRRLERSLREFELVQPLVWNRVTGHIVSGHQRFEILKQQGVAEVDVVVVELSLDQEKALNIALNNSLVGSDWDAAKLIDVVRELQDAPDCDVTLTGFDDAELRDLLFTPEEILPAEDQSESASLAMVRVRFEVSPDAWESVRHDLDPLIAQHHLHLHVHLPSDKNHSKKS